MDRTHGWPERAALGAYFLARLERLLALPVAGLAARGEPGLALVQWALRSTFGDCRVLGYGQKLGKTGESVDAGHKDYKDELNDPFWIRRIIESIRAPYLVRRRGQ